MPFKLKCLSMRVLMSVAVIFSLACGGLLTWWVTKTREEDYQSNLQVHVVEVLCDTVQDETIKFTRIFQTTLLTMIPFLEKSTYSPTNPEDMETIQLILAFLAPIKEGSGPFVNMYVVHTEGGSLYIGKKFDEVTQQAEYRMLRHNVYTNYTAEEYLLTTAPKFTNYSDKQFLSLKSPPNFNTTTRPYYLQGSTLAAGAHDWTGVFYSGGPESLVITVVAPVFHPNGTLKYVACLDAGLEYLDSYLETEANRLSPETRIALIESDGYLLASSVVGESTNVTNSLERGNAIPNRVALFQVNDRLLRSAAEVLGIHPNNTEPYQERLFHGEVSGIPGFVYLRPTTLTPGRVWWVLVIIPDQVFLPEDAGFQIESFLFVIIVLVLCSVASMIGLSLLVFRPLHALQLAMGRIYDEDYDLNPQQASMIPVMSEIRELQHEFFTMRRFVRAQTRTEAERAAQIFLSTMSHELRTPLSAIMGFTEILKSSHLTDKQGEYVNIVGCSAEGMLHQVNDILDFSRLECGKVELEVVGFSIYHCLETNISICYAKAREKQNEILYYVAPGVPAIIYADYTRLSQILLNLMGNAVKFTQNGTVIVRISRATPQQIRDGNRPNGLAALFIEITDTGIGFEPEAGVRLFKIFSQLDNTIARKYGGTGLGLAICHKLVTLMGWGISGQSPGLGLGSTFSFFLEDGYENARGPDSRTSPLIREPRETYPYPELPSRFRGNLSGLRVSFWRCKPKLEASLKALVTSLGCTVVSGFDDVNVIFFYKPKRQNTRHGQHGSSVQELLKLILLTPSDIYTNSPASRMGRIHMDGDDPVPCDGLASDDKSVSGGLDDKEGIRIISIVELDDEEESEETETGGEILAQSKPIQLDGKLARPIKVKDVIVSLLGKHARLEFQKWATPRESSQSLEAFDNKRILIVDDTEINRKLLTLQLGQLGITQLDEACNGQEALTFAFEGSTPYDMIFMDVSMPVMDGLEATQRLRQSIDYANVPILGLTAYTLPVETEKALGAGMSAVLTKPITAARVKEAIHEYFLTHSVAAEPSAIIDVA